MSDQPDTTVTPSEAPESAPEAAQAAPWGDDFDAERAWKTIQNLRAREKELSARKFLTPEDEQRLSEYARLEEASQTELERLQKQAETASQRNKSLTDRAVSAEVKAFAAGKFADPSDALAFLGDLSKYVGNDDSIDTEAIATDLNDLLARKPHLAPAQERVTPRPNPAQGASGSAPETGAPQLTKQDLERLYSEKKYDQIEEARKKGQLKNLFGATP